MAETELQVGDVIDHRYRVLSVIGTGGMGALYRVSDEADHDGEVIALKTVRLRGAAADSPERVEHLRREFQLLTQLRHPNLVSVYDFGVMKEGELYFTMEWVEGVDLEPSLHPLEPGATVPVMVQVCRALAYLHARGVIHGDLKPGNVLIAGDGDDAGPASDRPRRIKLVDFGLAHEIRSPEERGRYYTPGYAAPEVRGQDPLDHRTDLYSLGAMWYALLVGQPAMFMPGPGKERLIQLTLNGALERQDQVPKEMGAVIARLMATSPDNRYGSANEVIEAINEITGSAYALETQETASSYALRTHFVNREEELDTLQTLWRQAQSDAGKLVLISGESGVGKSRLVGELEIQVEMEGARVVWGQCVESGGSAYHPWREVLRVLTRYVEGADEAAMQRVGPVLAALLPELWERDHMRELAPPADLDPQAAQQRLNDVMVQLLRIAAGLRPTLIVIENAHWADEATLELLRFLARIPGHAGLLTCVTYRDDELTSEHTLERLDGERVRRVRLRRLSPEVTTELVRSMLGLDRLPPLLTERVQQTTGGNAFFVQELIRSLAAEGDVLQRTVRGWQVDGRALQEIQLPESIQQVVGRRLGQLSPGGRRMLSWAAVMGMVFWEGAVAEAQQIPWQRVRAALREGIDQDLVRVRDEASFAGEREYLFLNPTVWEACYESVAPEERREEHARAAVWLMTHHEGEVDAHLGLIADHLEKAGQIEHAIVYLRRAGEQAAAQFANEEAVAYLSRALALTPEPDLVARYDLLLVREAVYHLQGDRDAQARDLSALQNLAWLLQRPGEQAEAALRRARMAIATGDYLQAMTSAQTAIAQAQAAGDVEREAAAQLRWGEALRRQNEYTTASERLLSALALAQTAGRRDLEVDILLSLANVADSLGDKPKSRGYYERSLAIAREMGYRQGEGLVLESLGNYVASQGDYAGAQDCLEQALAIAREMGYRQGEGWALHDLGLVARTVGDYARARDYFEQNLLLFREIDDRPIEGVTFLNLGVIARSFGDYGGARDYFERGLAIAREIGDRSRESLALHNLGIVAGIQGDYARAQDYCEQALTISREIGSRVVEGYALVAMGNVLVEMVEPGAPVAALRQTVSPEREREYLADAADSYRQALDIERELGTPGAIMESLAGLARVSLLQGDLAQAQLQIEEILSYLQRGNTLDGTEEPLRIYLTCCRILRANLDPRAEAILSTAHRLLQEQAAQIGDEETRRSFLDNVAAHREIVREFEEDA